MYMKDNQISSAELEVMQVLWHSKKSMRIQEVLDSLKDSSWKYNTVGTLLLRLEAKGAVKSSKDGRAIVYTPILDEDEYRDQQTKSFVQKLYNGSVKELAVSLFKSETLSEEDISDIRKMFDL